MFFCPILGLFSLRSQSLTTFFVRFNHLPTSGEPPWKTSIQIAFIVDLAGKVRTTACG